ncbi:MAG TPA: hypothetical protein VF057_07645 [Thermoanaerobaculia bacterium]
MAERVDVDERNRGEFSGGPTREERRTRLLSERRQNKEAADRRKVDLEIHIGKASE